MQLMQLGSAHETANTMSVASVIAIFSDKECMSIY